jgi:hypothetical protein
VCVTLTEYPVEEVTDRYTAISYIWGQSVALLDLKNGDVDRSVVSSHPDSPQPDTLELIIVPASEMEKSRTTDDKPGCVEFDVQHGTTRLSLPKRCNLSEFSRAYLTGFPKERRKPCSDMESGSYTMRQVSFLWIDAIYIDQSNSTQEKATRIPAHGRDLLTRSACCRVAGRRQCQT